MEKLIALRPEMYLTVKEYEQLQTLVVAERLLGGSTLATELAEKALNYGASRYYELKAEKK